MAKGSNLIAKILLKGQTDPSLQRAFKQANQQADASIEKFKSYGTIVSKAVQAVGAAAVAGLGASAKAAIDYESAFAGVMKTVDETPTTTYEDLSDAIRNMAKTMPATTEEIAGVAEAAGQLGIKADDIEKFTKIMINLGTTTNLSSEEAATSIAKMFNVTGTSMSEVDRFGATLVALGNNAATTESDILAMATRIAGSGKQIGLSEQQILALSTSLSSVGIEAEMGGSAISTTMTQIDKAVALNSESLGVWAQTAGMSATAFSEMWKNDAYGAMQKVIQGMGQAKDEGGNLNLLLEDLGINGIRQGDMLKRLSSASGLMAEMTELANTAWDENSALSKEANTRYATMASRIQILKNRFYDVGITVGQAMMPAIEKVMTKLENINWDAIADKIVGALDWVGEHSQQIMTVISALAGAFIGFKIASFISTIVGVVKWVMALSKAFGFIKVAMALLGGPVTIVITVIGALVGAFIYLWNTSEGFRNFWIGLWNKIKEMASNAGAWLKNFFTVTLPNAFNVAKEKVVQFITNVKNFFMNLPYNIGYALGYAIGKVYTWGKNLISWARTAIPNFLTAVGNFFSQLPERIWTWLVNAKNKVVQWGGDLMTKGKEAATKLKDAVVTAVQELPSKMLEVGKNTVQGIWNGIKNAKEWLIDKVKSFASGITDGIKAALGINSPSVVMEKLFKWVPVGAGEGIIQNAKYAVNAVKSMGSKVASAASNISPTIQTKVSSVGEKIKAFGKGGTVTQPQHAIVGDAPETIVPHGNTPRNRSLLNEAAKGVGVPTNGGNTISITFAPVINGGNAEENRRMLHEEEAEFERKMDEYFARKARLAF